MLTVLRPINTDRDFARRRAEALVEAAIGSNPEIVFGDTQRRQEARAGRLIDAEQQPNDGDHVVFDERLIEQRV